MRKSENILLLLGVIILFAAVLAHISNSKIVASSLQYLRVGVRAEYNYVDVKVSNTDSKDHFFEALGNGIILNFATPPANATNEVRVYQCDFEENSPCIHFSEIPSWIWNKTSSEGKDLSANINFETNTSANSWRIYEIRYNTENSTYPDYKYQVWSDNFNRNYIGNWWNVSMRSENTTFFDPNTTYPCYYLGINDSEYLNVVCASNNIYGVESSLQLRSYNLSSAWVYPASIHELAYFKVIQNGTNGPRGTFISRLWNRVDGELTPTQNLVGIYTEEECGVDGTTGRTFSGILVVNGDTSEDTDINNGQFNASNTNPCASGVMLTDEGQWRDLELVYNGVDSYSLFVNGTLTATVTDSEINNAFSNTKMVFYNYFHTWDPNDIADFRLADVCIVTRDHACNTYHNAATYMLSPEEQAYSFYLSSL